MQTQQDAFRSIIGYKKDVIFKNVGTVRGWEWTSNNSYNKIK
jgi:hypothetical protein